MRIGIINYGAGNILSVQNALKYLGSDFCVVSKGEEFAGISTLIFPGVGAFGDCILGLQERNLLEPIKEWLEADKHFLGICVGYQVLFEASEESPGVNGLGFFSGMVRRFSEESKDGNSSKVPQIGWNGVKFAREKSGFLTDKLDLNEEQYFYFVHSYYTDFADLVSAENFGIGVTNYGIDYISAAKKGNVVAVQFHPEKSQRTGLEFLQGWIESCS